jgi:hypothetical protein
MAETFRKGTSAMPLTSSKAREMGRIGAATKWSRAVTPDERRAATQAARDTRWNNLVTQATTEAAARGQTLTDAQAQESARRLQDRAMARARMAIRA